MCIYTNNNIYIMYVCIYVPHYSYLIVPCKIIFGDLPSRCVQARLLSLLASLSLSERTLATLPPLPLLEVLATSSLEARHQRTPTGLTYPMCNPWCWHIYLQNWVISRAKVGKYSSTMEHMGMECSFLVSFTTILRAIKPN